MSSAGLTSASALTVRMVQVRKQIPPVETEKVYFYLFIVPKFNFIMF